MISMKKFTRIISLVLAIATLVFCSGTAFASEEGSPGIYFAVLGDSIASGYGLRNTLDCYGALVSEAKSYHLTNDAVPGHTTENLLWVIFNSATARKSIKRADVISVSICGNDLIQFLTKADTPTLLEIMTKGMESSAIKELLEETAFNLGGICTELRALNPNAPIILQTQYNPLYANPQYSTFASLAEELAPALKDIFETLCKEHGNVYLADVHAVFDDYYKTEGNYDIIQADGIHPSEAGHALIAQVLLEKINELEEAGLIPRSADLYYLLGDADGNTRLSVSDATVIQKITAGLLSYVGDLAKLCLDADENGSVNIKDATAIQKHLADLPSNPNIGKYLPFYEY